MNLLFGIVFWIIFQIQILWNTGRSDYALALIGVLYFLSVYSVVFFYKYIYTETYIQTRTHTHTHTHRDYIHILTVLFCIHCIFMCLFCFDFLFIHKHIHINTHSVYIYLHLYFAYTAFTRGSVPFFKQIFKNLKVFRWLDMI